MTFPRFSCFAYFEEQHKVYFQCEQKLNTLKVLVQKPICFAEIFLFWMEVVDEVQSKDKLERHNGCQVPNKKPFSHTLWWEQFTSASITSAMNEVTQQTAAVVPLARAIAVISLSVKLEQFLKGNSADSGPINVSVLYHFRESFKDSIRQIEQCLLTSKQSF